MIFLSIEEKNNAMWILISSQRGNERDAQSEMWYILKERLEINSKPIHCSIPGLSLLRIKEKKTVPEIMQKIREIAAKEHLMACLRIIPLEMIIKTDPEEIRDKCLQYTTQIKPTDKWRITTRTRHTKIRGQELIEIIAPHIKNGEVDLENPDKILRIEILGSKTGICLHRPSDEIRIKEIENEIDKEHNDTS